MGTYLYHYRLGLDQALDVLTDRLPISELEFELPHLQQVHQIKNPSPAVMPHVLGFQKAYPLAFDLVTGEARNPFWSVDHFSQEHTDPAAWAVYGARRIGWQREDILLRYSLPKDIDQILKVLRALTLDELRRRLVEVLAPSEHYQDDDLGDSWIRYTQEKFLPPLLSNLRRFYEAARAEDQIVVYRMF